MAQEAVSDDDSVTGVCPCKNRIHNRFMSSGVRFLQDQFCCGNGKCVECVDSLNRKSDKMRNTICSKDLRIICPQPRSPTSKTICSMDLRAAQPAAKVFMSSDLRTWSVVWIFGPSRRLRSLDLCIIQHGPGIDVRAN